ncbi:MAG: DUF4190 domain-containing protein [Planctomycetota bacterium]|nr:DUF4190 domain-containing protein [Planctomycetota bacterium]
MNTEAIPDSAVYPPPELTAATGPVRWSRLAMASIVLSVLPIGSILAPILGIIALFRFRGRPDLLGRGLAWGGIVLGLVASALMVASAYGIYLSFMNLAARPSTALQAAWAGDPEQFRLQMVGPGKDATAATIAEWIAPLRERFGTLERVEIAANGPPTEATATPAVARTEREMRARYVAVFRNDSGETRLPLDVTFERPVGVDAVTAILVRRFRFDLPGGARIVFPDDERTDPEQPAQDPRP